MTSGQTIEAVYDVLLDSNKTVRKPTKESNQKTIVLFYSLLRGA